MFSLGASDALLLADSAQFITDNKEIVATQGTGVAKAVSMTLAQGVT